MANQKLAAAVLELHFNAADVENAMQAFISKVKCKHNDHLFFRNEKKIHRHV